MDKNTRVKIFELYYDEHMAIWEIAKALDITEYEVLKVLGKN